MKAWERTNEPISNRARPSDPKELIARMALSFEIQSLFWRALGKRTKGVCQFHVEGSSLPHWFVELDERGARVRGGEHPKPSAVWRSKADTVVSLMRGESRPHRDLKLEGDLDLLWRLFCALSSRV